MKIPATGNEAGDEGRLQDDPACRRGGGGDRGSHPCNARPLGGACPEEDWGFILIDAQNAFNEEKQKSMLWAI